MGSVSSLIHKLALGTVQFGLDYGISNHHGKTAPSEAGAILDLAALAGITTLDTAHVYGESEAVLGLYDAGRFAVVSKWPAPEAGRGLSAYLEESLARLRLPSLHGWIAHAPDAILREPDLNEEAEALKAKGLVQKTGYSVTSPAQLHDLVRRFGTPDLVQLPFNLLDRRFAGAMQELKAAGTEIHVRSAFLQGLLLLEADGLPDFFGPLKPWLREFQHSHSEPERLAAALGFCLQHEAVDKVVVGVNTKAQLETNLSALNLVSPPIPDPIELPEQILNPALWPKRA